MVHLKFHKYFLKVKEGVFIIVVSVGGVLLNLWLYFHLHLQLYLHPTTKLKPIAGTESKRIIYVKDLDN